MSEEWRDIPGYEGMYQVSDIGRVRSLDRPQHPGRILAQTDNGAGYLQLTLSKDSRPMKHTVHKLVLLAFIGPLPEGYNRNHRNGNKHDNRLANLEYVSYAENTRHAIKVLGKQFGNRGEKSGAAKLSNEQVREIRRLYATGEHTSYTLAGMFKVGKSTIQAITSGKAWSHLL